MVMVDFVCITIKKAIVPQFIKTHNRTSLFIFCCCCCFLLLVSNFNFDACCLCIEIYTDENMQCTTPYMNSCYYSLH